MQHTRPPFGRWVTDPSRGDARGHPDIEENGEKLYGEGGEGTSHRSITAVQVSTGATTTAIYLKYHTSTHTQHIYCCSGHLSETRCEYSATAGHASRVATTYWQASYSDWNILQRILLFGSSPLEIAVDDPCRLGGRPPGIDGPRLRLRLPRREVRLQPQSGVGLSHQRSQPASLFRDPYI